MSDPVRSDLFSELSSMGEDYRNTGSGALGVMWSQSPSSLRLSGEARRRPHLGRPKSIATPVATLGTFFAVMLLQVLRNVFNLLNLGSFYRMTVTGLIIVAAVLLNRLIDIRRGRG